jgi:peptidoglycan/LPS O-acetylase OafA/YrhL
MHELIGSFPSSKNARFWHDTSSGDRVSEFNGSGAMNVRDVPNLDFVRSVAVISVVVEHTLIALGITQIGPFPVAYFGVMGVQIFFVLTSLVLMWSLERKPHPLDFYIRRFFRIYPLALAAIAVALFFHSPTGGDVDDFFAYADPSLKQLAAQLTLLVPTQGMLLTVMWSLPFEVEMYVLLPILFFFVRRNFVLWPLVLIWLLVLLNARHVPDDQVDLLVAMGYFLPGVMAYVGFGRWKPRFPAWSLPIFLAVVWTAFWYKCDFHKGWYFCLIVGLTLPLFQQSRSKVVWTPSRIIAKYSYGIYLTHPFALVIGLYLLRDHSWPVRMIGALVPLIALPLLAYQLIEHPLIHVGSRLAAKAETRYERREAPI